MTWIFDLLRFYLKVLKKYGKPRNIIYCLGGLGDDLCLTLILKAYFLKHGHKPNILSRRPLLFEGNPYVNALLDPDDINRWGLLLSFISKLTGKKLAITHLAYHHQPIDEFPDRSTHKHMLHMMASAIGIGEHEFNLLIQNRHPLLYQVTSKGNKTLIPAEKFILIHSSSMSAPYPVKIKEWTMFENSNRFVSFCAKYGNDINQRFGRLVQIGDISDPLLPNSLDLRGKTDLATLALLCKEAECFIGLEGGIMHFARAYETPSLIIYGGRTMPEETGYYANNVVNLYTPVSCSPCWGTATCPFDQNCMAGITEDVLYHHLSDLMHLSYSTESSNE